MNNQIENVNDKPYINPKRIMLVKFFGGKTLEVKIKVPIYKTEEE